MTRTNSARIAGFTLLLYIGVGITSMMISGKASAGSTPALRLASIAEHAMSMRINALLTLVTFLCAVVLGVTLYALTRDEDRELSMLAMLCRVTEGTIGVIAAVRSLSLVNVALASATETTDTVSARMYGSMMLLERDSSGLVAATCFAIGSTLFSYLFLRARNIPLWLAWLGVAASVLLILLLPIQIVGLAPRWMTNGMWLPMLVFEVSLSFYLMFRGVRQPANPPLG